MKTTKKVGAKVPAGQRYAVGEAHSEGAKQGRVPKPAARPAPAAAPKPQPYQVWMLRNVLEQGLVKLEVLKVLSGGYVVCKGYPRALKLGVDCERDFAEAAIKAKRKKRMQLERLRKQIDALEKLSFEGAAA